MVLIDQRVNAYREVPRNDLADNTDGFMASVSKLALVCLDDLSVVLVCPTSVVADALNRSRHIDGPGP